MPSSQNVYSDIKVNVWKYQSITSLGHVSMSLDDGTYISWWPKNGGLTFTMPLDLLSPVELHKTLDEDNASEGRDPDTIYVLTVMMNDVENVSQWWSEFCEKHQTYSGLELNCATVVYKALTLVYPGAKKIEPLVWAPWTVDALVREMSKVKVITDRLFDYLSTTALSYLDPGIVGSGLAVVHKLLKGVYHMDEHSGHSSTEADYLVNNTPRALMLYTQGHVLEKYLHNIRILL